MERDASRKMSLKVYFRIEVRESPKQALNGHKIKLLAGVLLQFEKI